MHHVDTWTPKLVGERLIEAIRWARYNAGPTGPAPVRALMPTYIASPKEREEAGWDGQENVSDPTEVPNYRRPLKPREVSALIEALYWPAKYSVVELPTATRILNVWLRCKVYRGNFDKVIEHRGEFSRATAYRYRDKALAPPGRAFLRVSFMSVERRLGRRAPRLVGPLKPENQLDQLLFAALLQITTIHSIMD